jgi:hypothetical protein
MGASGIDGLEVFYLNCGYEMVLDLGFLEISDSGMGVWVY